MQQQRLTVQVGNVVLGGGLPIVIQSMTDTPTADIHATVQQIKALADAGSELVRITIDDERAAAAVPAIINRLRQDDYHVPIVGDFHYNGHQLLKQVPAMASMLDKYRINPGNVGFKHKWDIQFSQMIDMALRYEKPVRIGGNWGSLDSQVLAKAMDDNNQLDNPRSATEVAVSALIDSVLSSAQRAIALGMPANRIVISAKVSRVQELCTVYRALHAACPYPLHVGLTEAGPGRRGWVATTAALAPLLVSGIGDTIRASLTPGKNQARTDEVLLCQDILQALGLRQFSPEVTACPGCGRTTSKDFQSLAEEVEQYVKQRMSSWIHLSPEAAHLRVAVMGCIVNGPGESKHADIGISLPGSGEHPVAPVFADGIKIATLRGASLQADFFQLIEDYVQQKYRAN